MSLIPAMSFIHCHFAFLSYGFQENIENLRCTIADLDTDYGTQELRNTCIEV